MSLILKRLSSWSASIRWLLAPLHVPGCSAGGVARQPRAQACSVRPDCLCGSAEKHPAPRQAMEASWAQASVVSGLPALLCLCRMLTGQDAVSGPAAPYSEGSVPSQGTSCREALVLTSESQSQCPETVPVAPAQAMDPPQAVSMTPRRSLSLRLEEWSAAAGSQVWAMELQAMEVWATEVVSVAAGEAPAQQQRTMLHTFQRKQLPVSCGLSARVALATASPGKHQP